ncbi:MAG: gfo/Idh/MocA family oxidoreductase, partial [Acidobacteria bacterium]|nr:gfo/Idh/MocA family oxidoreductase [Acidobacteriota bacterium]
EVIAPTGAPGGSRATAPIPEGFDWELWQGPAAKREFAPDRCVTPGHYHITDYSIGFLGGWGAHPLDVLDWAVPKVPVEYEGTGLVPKEGLFDTVMNWDMRCRYADGVTLSFKTGSDATTFRGADGWVRISRTSITSSPEILVADFAKTPFNNMGANHLRNFIDAIRRKVQPESPIDSAIRSDLISHLSNSAVRTGRKIKWDPAKEVIVGDPEAAKMTHGELRAPWNKFV